MKAKQKILVLLILCGVFAFTFPAEKYFDIAKSLDIFATLFKEVNTHYVDEVEPQKLIRVGIDAMLESLDPYTNYIAEEEVESFRSMTTGQYAGIGALIGKVGNKVVFTHPYPGFPANKSGIKVGDEILMVNGIDVKGKSTQEISSLLKGQPRTEVKVLIKRYGAESPLTFNLKRERISVKNVSFSDIIYHDVGLIKLDDFTPGAGKEVLDAVANLKSKGVKFIILDLRDNPGGMLQEAVNVVNVFIPKGKEVVSTKGKVADWNKSYYTLNAAYDTQIPLAVLIGPTSASAAEIVAGTLQDYDRAVLIGKRTFGKGLVQTTRPLTYNGQLKVTTAKYYIPSGRCIQALDYQHRDVNGKASKNVDSLRVAFKTKSGRVVYDGSGIEPDITVDNDELSSITYELLSQGLIFDFATEFYYNKIQSGHAVQFTDTDYPYFVNWIKRKNFTYNSQTELKFNELIESTKEDKNSKELEAQLQSFKLKIDEIKQTDFDRFRNQITSFIKQEIAFRHNLVEGQVMESVDSDKEIQRAISLLNSGQEFKTILSKN